MPFVLPEDLSQTSIPVKNVKHLIILFLSAALPATAQQSRADSIAGIMMKDLAQTTWQTSYKTWQDDHNGDSCQEFHGDSGELLTNEEWCFRCIEHHGGLKSERYFFAFDTAQSAQCRLQQLTCSLTGYPFAVLAQAHEQLVRLLSSTPTAVVETMNVHSQRPRERGSANWRNWIRIHTDQLSVYAYLDSMRRKTPGLWLVARDFHLADEKQRCDTAWMLADKLEERIANRLAAELKPNFPTSGELLSHGADFDSEFQEKLYRGIVELLDSSERNLADRPMLWVAADLLLKNLSSEDPSWASRREALQKYGLSFIHLELRGWYYQHDLLWRCSNQFAAGMWGEAAFTFLLNSGFDSTGHCGDGSDKFTEVIASGEKFLVEHPTSTWCSEIIYNLARAYETWWSITKAENDIYVGTGQQTKYRPGAENARQKAIDYYEKVIHQLPSDDRLTYIKHRLPRLKLGIDTNQRAFWCIYD